MNKIFLRNFFIAITVLLVTFLAFVVFAYLAILPNFVKSQKVNNYLSKITKEYTNLDLEYKKPNLKTYLKPQIDFSIDKLYLKSKDVELVNLEDFEISVSFDKVFQKQIKLNKLFSKKLVIKADKLASELKLKEQNKQQQKSDWYFDLYSSQIDLDNFFVSYNQKNKTSIELFANKIKLVCKKDYKILSFDLKGKILGNNSNIINFSTNSDNEVEIYNDGVKINNLNFKLNHSNVNLTSFISAKNLSVKAKSNRFYLDDIFKIVNSNFVIPNGSSLLKPLIKPQGCVKFDVKFENNDLSGYILADNTKASIKDLTALPINIQKGKIEITKDKVIFKNLVGYYGTNKINEIKILGDIKDYYKTMDSNIEIETKITNDFLKNYLAPLALNTVFKVSQPTKTKIIYKSKNNIMDIVWLAKVPKGVDFGINNSVPTLTKYDRAVKGDFHIENNKLTIKNINYYIAQEITRGKKLTPIIIVDGKMGLNGKIDNIGFAFGRQMPSEFLNIFAGPKTFKKGTVEGKMHVVYKNDIPTLSADMQLNMVIMPAQRLFIKSAKLTTDDKYINLAMDGGFKRIKYNLTGKLKNELNPPFVIDKMDLNIDDLDAEKLLLSVNNQNNVEQNVDKINSENDIKDDNYFFDTNLIRIKDADFYVKKGHFKEITFSDIQAEMTLDEKGILQIKSNKFNIAQGTSGLKLVSDLKNLTYNIKLGMKDVDSNLMAKTLLNLDKEISGKAKGLLELNTDRNLKLNGNIKFSIDDGAIGKIGLVEYLLKVASVFRNPIVMISPSVLMDIVNIPEGKFNKISGKISLKDNVAYRIDINSTAPTLAALVRGRFDLEKHDASLRIYTRFSTQKKSVFGFLRNISLNAIANKVQMNNKNDLNYYSAELAELPQIDVSEDKSQIFLTNIEGDVERNNYLSSLKKIK